ncbi:leucine-rich repeat domain-containing protein [Pantanalinema sp. GBBB05]|uniref:leucine-rich repeat domain-containing protein n=1 Tax=Pantanalinema sp. GBBB05 TaxID=2604139 RepID=UPI001D8CCA83|nr:leucine-rich repeat domain-containing protein [Pantanalinema sp. GBBB05]
MSELRSSQMPRFTTFTDWCRHFDQLSLAEQNTVKALLKRAGKTDCHEAERQLAGHTNVSLTDLQVVDLSPLRTLPSLTHLMIRCDQIEHLEELAACANLNSLKLECSHLTDITPLAAMTQLTHLTLSYTQVRDLRPLRSLANLTYLNLYCTPVTDISPLQSLTHLNRLDLGKNQITDFRPLHTLTNLTWLSMPESHLADLTPLQSLTKLVRLDLSNNAITDLSPLEPLNQLTVLNLGYNQISDLSPLASLHKLANLNCYYNQIHDLSPLRSLANLTILSCPNNPLPELSVSAKLIERWQALATQPIQPDVAIAAAKALYQLCDRSEPTVLVCSSPWAGINELFARSHLSPQVKLELDQQIQPAALSPALWNYVLGQMQFAPDDEIKFAQRRQIHQSYTHQDPKAWLKFVAYCADIAITSASLMRLISSLEYINTQLGSHLSPDSTQALDCLHQLFETCGWIIPFEDVCVVCDRPNQLFLDQEQRLHGEGEAAIAYRDGFKVYAHHGTTLPAKYGSVHLNQWQAPWLLEETNAELRRILIQGIGYGRICQELQAIALDSWREYTLLKIDANADIEPIHLLKMVCPSTSAIHVLRVPPHLTTARAAIRWANWEIDPESFSIET